MNSTIKSSIPFYVIRYLGAYYATGMTLGGQYYATIERPRTTVGQAKRFTNLIEAAKFTTQHFNAKSAETEIVRVTEVPGTSTRKVVSTRHIDATKPVVLYNKRKEMYVTFTRYGLEYTSDVTRAHVYSDLGEALKFHFPATTCGMPEEILVHQVETVETPSTFTEVVVDAPKIVLRFTGISSRRTLYVGKHQSRALEDLKAVVPFSSLLEAAPEVKRWDGSGEDFQIVSLSEIPGTPTRRHLGEIEQAKADETTQYIVRNAFGWLLYGRFNEWTKDLEKAAVFSSRESASAALQRATLGQKYVMDDIYVSRIAVSNGTPTITQTVLK